MTTLSRRQFLRTSGAVFGATMASPLGFPARGRAAEVELIPKKFPFPPNDQYGSYEPTITGDGNTIYFARFAGTGDKRVAGTTTDIFVTHRIRQGGEWPGTGADWTVPERLPDTINSDAMEQEPRISPDGKTLYFMSRRSSGAGGGGHLRLSQAAQRRVGEGSDARTEREHAVFRSLLHAERHPG